MPHSIYTPEDYFRLGSGIVSLSGSRKQIDKCMNLYKYLTHNNWIVLLCGSWIKTDCPKRLHLEKVLASDSLAVILDETGNYDADTTHAIQFANFVNMPVFYYDGEEITGDNVKQIPRTYEDSILIDRFLEKFPLAS